MNGQVKGSHLAEKSQSKRIVPQREKIALVFSSLKTSKEGFIRKGSRK